MVTQGAQRWKEGEKEGVSAADWVGGGCRLLQLRGDLSGTVSAQV